MSHASTSASDARRAPPPDFVMWRSIPESDRRGWQRYWFGGPLDSTTRFRVRGLGLREPMFNADVHRPIGTGDWLVMFFHAAARLDRSQAAASVGPGTLMIWPPGAEQFYSWGKRSGCEPHTWMHVEGSWVGEQVAENGLPAVQPVSVAQAEIITDAVAGLIKEMIEGEPPDAIILRNLFQNWARQTARCLPGGRDQRPSIPQPVAMVRAVLDEEWHQRPALDQLAAVAGVSRSHLCHAFRRHLGMTITDYVIRRRMAVAERLLYDLDRPIGTVAKDVGYPDLYQFSRQFHKTFGMSPTRYRRQQATSHGADR